MACQAMHWWTFSRLVGAFVDLAIAYLLLCASTIAFLTSRFLGIFGLCLPCSCNGLFGTSNNTRYCLNRMLVHCPTEAVSNVQVAVMTKFPFDSVWPKGQNCQLDMKLVGERNNGVDGFVELEGEGSCSTISDARKRNVVERESDSGNEIEFGLIESPGVIEGRFDLKGKGIMNQRPKGGIYGCRKGGVVDHGKLLSISSFDPPCSNRQGIYRSTINTDGDETIEGDGEDPVLMRMGDRAALDFELNEVLDENNVTEKQGSSIEGDEESTLRILEQALQEEHAARSALYLELEKERSSAATAADEAMAMILRLQEEKASVEMQARQYQRMIEEKSEYDAEEMDILKEILVRRETEKHFLEKQVAAYRQMINLGNEQSECDVQDSSIQSEWLTSLIDLSEDPVLMLQQLSESIDKMEMMKDTVSDKEVTFVDRRNSTLAVGNETPIQVCDGYADFLKRGEPDNLSLASHQGNQKPDMEMLSAIRNPDTRPRVGQRLEMFPPACKSRSSQIHDFREKIIALACEEQEKRDSVNLYRGMPTRGIEIRDQTEMCNPYNTKQAEKCGIDAYQGSKDPCNLAFDQELHVHDVHVITDVTNMYNEAGGNINEPVVNDTSYGKKESDFPSQGSAQQRMDVIGDYPSTSRLDTEPRINRSKSDMPTGLQPLPSHGRSLLSDPRRDSMSALDKERLKIDNEVGWLRDRLRIVQERREKLNLTVEHPERETLQLKLLEDIARQLQEIRQLTTEHGKAVRQASLPLPSS